MSHNQKTECIPGYSVHQFIVPHVTHSIDFAVTAIEVQWRIYFLCSVNKKIKSKNLIMLISVNVNPENFLGVGVWGLFSVTLLCDFNKYHSLSPYL